MHMTREQVGVLFMAMPITIVGSAFAHAWEAKRPTASDEVTIRVKAALA